MGRSTVAAALAIRAADAGARVLAVDVVADGGLSAALSSQRDSASHNSPGSIEVLALSTEEALREYLDIYLRLPVSPSRIGPIASIFDYVATAAPGVREILTIGKIAYEVREANWDLVVVDGPATGHCVELLAAADNLRDLIGIGPLVEQTTWVADILGDPTLTGILVVAQPEELPVLETVDLVARLAAETAVDVAGLVVNRVPTLLDQADIAEAKRLATGDDGMGWAAHIALTNSNTAHEQLEQLALLQLPTTLVPVDAAPIASALNALDGFA